MANSRAGGSAVTAIADAASVVLTRERGTAVAEVFVVRRSETLRFFGGYHAFPGGRVAAEDAAIPFRGGLPIRAAPPPASCSRRPASW